MLSTVDMINGDFGPRFLYSENTQEGPGNAR